VSRLPPCSSRGTEAPRFRCHLSNFDASSAVRLHSSLSPTHDVIKATPFNRNVHHHGFWPQQLPTVWSLPLQTGSEGSTFIFRTAWRFHAFLTQPPLFAPSTRAAFVSPFR